MRIQAQIFPVCCDNKLDLNTIHKIPLTFLMFLDGIIPFLIFFPMS